MRKSALGLAGILVGAASISQLGGCGTFYGRNDAEKSVEVEEFKYLFPTDDGQKEPIGLTGDIGSRKILQRTLFFLSQAEVDGMNSSHMISTESNASLRYAALWADSNGDGHITLAEANNLMGIAHSYSRGKSIPEDLRNKFRLVETNSEDYFIERNK